MQTLFHTDTAILAQRGSKCSSLLRYILRNKMEFASSKRDCLCASYEVFGLAVIEHKHMPFIAITAAVMIALGGGIAVSKADHGALAEVKDSLKSALHISTNTEVYGNATSSAAHERNEIRQNARAELNGSANAEMRADRAEIHGSGSTLVDINL